jgi:hypothetical protein
VSTTTGSFYNNTLAVKFTLKLLGPSKTNVIVTHAKRSRSQKLSAVNPLQGFFTEVILSKEGANLHNFFEQKVYFILGRK